MAACQCGFSVLGFRLPLGQVECCNFVLGGWFCFCFRFKVQVLLFVRSSMICSDGGMTQWTCIQIATFSFFHAVLARAAEEHVISQQRAATDDACGEPGLTLRARCVPVGLWSKSHAQTQRKASRLHPETRMQRGSRQDKYAEAVASNTTHVYVMIITHAHTTP